MRNALAILTAALTGLLAGAMVFIEAVLVPFWRGSSPREFREWFAQVDFDDAETTTLLRRWTRWRDVRVARGLVAALAAAATARGSR